MPKPIYADGDPGRVTYTVEQFPKWTIREMSREDFGEYLNRGLLTVDKHGVISVLDGPIIASTKDHVRELVLFLDGYLRSSVGNPPFVFPGLVQNERTEALKDEVYRLFNEISSDQGGVTNPSLHLMISAILRAQEVTKGDNRPFVDILVAMKYITDAISAAERG